MRVSSLCRIGLAAAFILSSMPVGNAWGASITVLPDASVIIQILNFVFLIWALNVVLYKPIRGILVKRSEKIDNLEETIEGLHGDAEQKENDWVVGIRTARAKGLEEKAALIQAAENEEKRIIEKINQKASEDLSNMRSKIKSDIDDVRTALQKDVDTFVDAIGRKILGRSVS
ncbi:MAG: ATP synthase F0 subunit B [Desulfobacterales bacterium]